jgi:hypothetical protein
VPAELPALPAAQNMRVPPSEALGVLSSPAGVPSGFSSTILPGMDCTTAIFPAGVRKNDDGRRNSPGPSPSRPTVRRNVPSRSKMRTWFSWMSRR